MVKIITDTSALYTVEEGKEMDVSVIPLSISINNKNLRDLCFDTKEFLKDIRDGFLPTSSQPPIGEVIDAFEKHKDEDIINICMADGLSGTYQSALSAKEQVENHDRVEIVNSKTLCGPHRYLVQKAVKLRDEGKNAKEVLKGLHDSIAHVRSFLIPQDFEFLKRGGRLKGSTATLGGLLKLKPIMEAVDGGTRLDKFAITRTLRKACDLVIKAFEEDGVDESYRIYVAHADALQDATMMLNSLKERFKKCEFELLELSPAFITQGGPECIAIQYIKK